MAQQHEAAAKPRTRKRVVEGTMAKLADEAKTKARGRPKKTEAEKEATKEAAKAKVKAKRQATAAERKKNKPPKPGQDKGQEIDLSASLVNMSFDELVAKVMDDEDLTHDEAIAKVYMAAKAAKETSAARAEWFRADKAETAAREAAGALTPTRDVEQATLQLLERIRDSLRSVGYRVASQTDMSSNERSRLAQAIIEGCMEALQGAIENR